MNFRFILPVVAGLALLACNSENGQKKFQLDVVLNNADKVPYTLVIDSSTTDMGHVDTLSVTDGKLVHSDTLDYPLHIILMSTKTDDYIDFFAENGHAKLVCDSLLSTGKLETSSTENALFQKYMLQQDSLTSRGEEALKPLYKEDMTEGEAAVYNEKVRALTNEMDDFRKQFIRNNPKSAVSAYLIFKNVRLDNLAELSEYYSLLDSSLESHPYVQIIKRAMDQQKKIAEGQPAPDFTVVDTDGKEVKLSDYRGKYVFLDFWASWCVPCRREIPHIVKAYHKYNNKNFEVLGFSLDFELDDLKEAVTSEKIPWRNVFGKDFADKKIEELYGIHAIPRNFLIDPDGVIIKRNLYGDELEKTLDEILK